MSMNLSDYYCESILLLCPIFNFYISVTKTIRPTLNTSGLFRLFIQTQSHESLQ